MIKRWQEDNLNSLLRARRVAHLTGARQCGKTTLAKIVAASKMRLMTLDNPAVLRAAQDDPIGFVKNKDGKALVIDEIQKAPELLNAIKMQVDRDSSRGQYLITGSSNLHFMKTVTDSLAGRLGHLRLRTLSLGEQLGSSGRFLSDAFRGSFKASYPEFGKREVIHQALQGGYPEVLDLSEKDRRLWYGDYLNDLLLRDIREITEVRKVEALREVAMWLLAHSTKFFDLKELCGKAALSYETALNYIAALKALYVFDEVPAWTGRDYAAIGKRSKYVVADTGLLANCLGWKEDRVYLDDDACGKLVESWVYHELASLADLTGELEISQYRDRHQHEIDFIVQNANGELLGIEVKSGTNVGSRDFQHLKWFKKNLSKGSFWGVVLYSGSETLSFGENLYAVPLSALGS